MRTKIRPFTNLKSRPVERFAFLAHTYTYIYIYIYTYMYICLYIQGTVPLPDKQSFAFSASNTRLPFALRLNQPQTGRRRSAAWSGSETAGASRAGVVASQGQSCPCLIYLICALAGMTLCSVSRWAWFGSRLVKFPFLGGNYFFKCSSPPSRCGVVRF